MRKVAKIAGVLWLSCFGAIFLAMNAFIAYTQGVMVVIDQLSPFNIGYYAIVFIVFLPGILLVNYGNKLNNASSTK